MQASLSSISSMFKSISINNKLPNPPGDPTDGKGGSFVGEVERQLDGLRSEANLQVRSVMTGDGTDIHTAMIATQKADLAFELALAARNKAVGAYQQLMNMQF